MTDEKTIYNSWHVAFAEVLKVFFTPLNLSVLPEVPVMGKSPEVDILLFQRETLKWTIKQQERLPDGIRQSDARSVLLEFKYTESVDKSALIQAQAYDYFYKQHQALMDKDVQTFIVSAKKPRLKTRKIWGYEQVLHEGVYKSNNELLKRIPLISLNELSDQRHNAYFKLFASHKVEREKAFKTLEREGLLPLLPEPLEMLLSGLRLLKGEEDMNLELTPTQVQEMGKIWGKRYLETLPVEKRLAGVKVADRLAGVKVADRLAGVKPEEVFSLFKPADIEAYLKLMKKTN
jgi:hypothetical protein